MVKGFKSFLKAEGEKYLNSPLFKWEQEFKTDDNGIGDYHIEVNNEFWAKLKNLSSDKMIEVMKSYLIPSSAYDEAHVEGYPQTGLVTILFRSSRYARSTDSVEFFVNTKKKLIRCGYHGEHVQW